MVALDPGYWGWTGPPVPGSGGGPIPYHPPVTELPPNFYTNPPAGTGYTQPPAEAPNIPVSQIDPRQLAQLRSSQPAHFTSITEKDPMTGNKVTTEYYNPNQYFLTLNPGPGPYGQVTSTIGLSPGFYRATQQPIERPQEVPAPKPPTLEQKGAEIYQNLPLF